MHELPAECNFFFHHLCILSAWLIIVSSLKASYSSGHFFFSFHVLWGKNSIIIPCLCWMLLSYFLFRKFRLLHYLSGLRYKKICWVYLCLIVKCISDRTAILNKCLERCSIQVFKLGIQSCWLLPFNYAQWSFMPAICVDACQSLIIPCIKLIDQTRTPTV